MITLTDGPAKGRVLMLRRAPYFLRVTRKRGTDVWDALDQPGDAPEPDEEVFVYRVSACPSWVHIKARKPNPSGTFMVADYHFFETQPEDSVLRINANWAFWCNSMPKEAERWKKMKDERK